MRKPALTLISLGALTLASVALALSASSGHSDATGTPVALVQTPAKAPPSLPDALDNANGLQTIAEALKVTGVDRRLEGKNSFTLLAPEDDAFAAAGDPDRKLMVPGDHTALTAFVMDHMLPGHVTPQDLDAAINASPDGTVTISSVGGDDLTFTRSGKAITVTAPDGSQAMLDGDPVSGGASIAIPINSVLQKMQSSDDSA